MKQPVIAVFDIGKTNKKFFLFDTEFNEVHQEYASFPETADDDGHPCENLPAVVAWMRETLGRFLASAQYEIRWLNFSTYGASFVHLDADGQPLTPLYNYTKPFPADLAEEFYASVGGKETFCVETASPALGMLNSGLQLYWLKKRKPEVFARVRHSLHFPQYCSYLFSGRLASDYTSVGCHTGLWNFATGRYHDWVAREQLHHRLPPLLPAVGRSVIEMNGQPVQVGTGLHDSSAALLPYRLRRQSPFLLLSTGTWNIALNPFNTAPLTQAELGQDCLQYLQPDGEPVKAARLFLGNEYNYQTQVLARHFGKAPDFFRQVVFDENLLKRWAAERRFFHWESLQFPDGSIASAPTTDLSAFDSYEAALHRLIVEMVDLQARSLKLAAGQTDIRDVIVDGGFANSPLFVETLRHRLPDFRIEVTPTPLGSSLGAAMACFDASLFDAS
jgi:sugar (pentulose or hexulose) kinase